MDTSGLKNWQFTLDICTEKKQLSSVVGLESTPGLESIFFGLRLGLGLEFLGLELGP